MPVRQSDEPQIIPGATVPEEGDGPVVVEDGREVFVYLTDSSETRRVRASVEVGTTVEIRCAFVSRVLTWEERATWRRDWVLPNGIGVNPDHVDCSITEPDGSKFEPTVRQADAGVFAAVIEVHRVGNWTYRFSARGSYTISDKRMLEVVR